MNLRILKMVARGRRLAFTLVELLSVIAIMVIMMSLTAPAASSFLKRTQIKAEAEKFASLLRNARQYALSNSTHTRVVFANSEIEEFSGGVYRNRSAYGAFAFFKPTLPAGGSDYKPFARADELAPEFASMPFTSIPSGFVGQFVPLPGSESWRSVKRRVEMVGFVPEEAELNEAYDRNFFASMNVLAKPDDEEASARSQRFISNFFYNPSKYWDPDGNAYYLVNIPNSQYPQNYYQTPFPDSYPRITTREMPSEPSNFRADGRYLRYDEMWSSQAELVYFDEIDDYKKLGEPDQESADSDEKMFFDLRGIEFSPKGIPTLTWADEVVFQFRPADGRKSPAYDVTIDRFTGLANVRLARKIYEETGSDTGGGGSGGSGSGGSGSGGSGSGNSGSGSSDDDEDLPEEEEEEGEDIGI